MNSTFENAAHPHTQVPDLDAIVVPVSGGGMISGIALCCSSLAHPRPELQQQMQVPASCKPGLKVIAAEPEGRQVSSHVFPPPLLATDEDIPCLMRIYLVHGTL